MRTEDPLSIMYHGRAQMIHPFPSALGMLWGEENWYHKKSSVVNLQCRPVLTAGEVAESWAH